ncbi:MAG TPA: hypothetical protein VF545_13115 [Thermoleophilaceae bacterium]|jgi:hypothetical protein
MAPFLVRHSLDALHGDGPRCSRCRRSPLVGELIHVLKSGRQVCSLCVRRLPSRQGAPVASERVRAGERPLEVVQRAA